MRKLLKHFILLPLIVAGAIALVIFQIKSKAPVEHQEVQFPRKSVEVIEIELIPFRARATAFGYVEPAVVVKARSELSGKVSFIHPGLKKGASLLKDTVVLRIEPTTFELSLNQSEAGLAGSQSTLVQLEAEEKSTQLALSIAQKNLTVGKKEFSRIKSIYDKGLIARSSLDKEEQKVLSLQQQVQDIQGKLAAFASRKEATRAQITQSKSQVDQSKDTLGRTEIRVPFDARISTVSVEKGEFVSAGTLLFEALGIQAVEITSELPTLQFRPLIAGLSDNKMSASGRSVSLTNPADMQAIIDNMKLDVRVRLVGDSNASVVWAGQLIRLGESVDPTRDTLGLVIGVDQPYEGIVPGVRPPLLRGMFTSVELLSQPRATLIVPRNAVHQGRVYVANSGNVLEIQQINILYQQGDMVVLDATKDSALVGQRLIVSDVIPVMEGLPLNAVLAKAFKEQLKRDALGERLAVDTAPGKTR